MPKIRFNKEALKGFFVSHVEKIALIVVLLLFVVFVYRGYSLEGLTGDQSPEKLSALADQAQQHMLRDSWETIAEDNEPPADHRQKAEQSRLPTRYSWYTPAKTLTPNIRRSGKPRTDPQLFAVVNLEVDVVTGPIALMMKKGDEDPLAAEPNSEPKQDTKKKKKKKKSRRTSPYGEGFEEMMEFGGEEMDGGFPGIPGMEGMEEEEEYSDVGMPGMGGMPGMNTLGGGARANPKDIPGFRAPQNAYGSPATLVAVKGVVPFEKQWNEYEAQFADAMGYMPTRDMPNYLTFTAERAEVGDDPNAELKWVPLTNTNHELSRLRTVGWAGVPQEVADPRYLRLNTLTMPAPPVMLRELDPLLLHSQVPRQVTTPVTALAGAAATTTETKTEMSDEPISDLPGQFPRGGTPGAPGGMPGMPGGMPGMPGGMPGMPGGMPGMPGGMPGIPGLTPGMDEDSEAAMGGYDNYGMEGMMEGMDGMEGFGGYGTMGGISPVMRGPQVEYLLVRFYDFSAVPGKKYRYRVQLLMEDPNHPTSPQLAPRDRMLDKDVRERLAAVAKEEETSKRRVFWRRTDWSEPSPVVTVKPPNRTLAGKIVQARSAKLPMGTATNAPELDVAASESMAKVMAIVWDRARATDVPAEVDGFRGMVLNFTRNADAIHPVTLQFKKLENYTFRTDRMIVDFRGGDVLPGSTDEESLLSPSEFIFLDENGNFFASNDVADVDAYTRYQLPTATDPNMSPMSGGFEDVGGYEDMMQGVEGFDGGAPPPGTGRRGR